MYITYMYMYVTYIQCTVVLYNIILYSLHIIHNYTCIIMVSTLYIVCYIITY